MGSRGGKSAPKLLESVPYPSVFRVHLIEVRAAPDSHFLPSIFLTRASWSEVARSCASSSFARIRFACTALDLQQGPRLCVRWVLPELTVRDMDACWSSVVRRERWKVGWGAACTHSLVKRAVSLASATRGDMCGSRTESLAVLFHPHISIWAVGGSCGARTITGMFPSFCQAAVSWRCCGIIVVRGGRRFELEGYWRLKFPIGSRRLGPST